MSSGLEFSQPSKESSSPSLEIWVLMLLPPVPFRQFIVADIDDTLARLAERGAKLVGDVVQYEDRYRLCYIRGPEGILIGLAQQLGQQTSRANPMWRTC